MFIACLLSLASRGQEITGDWHGALKVQGLQLRLVFHISQTGGGYSATMDSPDQNATGIPATASFERNVLKLSVANIGVEYEGALGADGNIKGTFKQMGQSFPLDMSRTALEKETPLRPQEPAKPYPYSEEEVVFENKQAGVRLAGTLTMPKRGKGGFPAVVLISGSGAQNRDEELMGHKPFLVIADYLTRHGIAVLRFDDRGTGASSGDFQSATSLDLSFDAEAAVHYLLTRKEINGRRIGLIGHSEGGSIAPMIAARSADVAFIVLLAGTGIPGSELLLLQDEALNRAAGMGEEDLQALVAFYRSAFNLVLQSPPEEVRQPVLAERLRELVANYPAAKEGAGGNDEMFVNSLATQLASPWMQYFLKYNPALELEKVKCPVLSLNGEKDLQVPAKANQTAIAAALAKGGNRAVTIKEFPGLNHLFQECETGRPAEYGRIEQTISPLVLEEIRTWIQE